MSGGEKNLQLAKLVHKYLKQKVLKKVLTRSNKCGKILRHSHERRKSKRECEVL